MAAAIPKFETPPWLPQQPDGSAASFKSVPTAGDNEGGGVYRPGASVPTGTPPTPVPQPQVPLKFEPAQGRITNAATPTTLYPNGAPYSWGDLLQEYKPAQAPTRTVDPATNIAAPNFKPLTKEDLALQLTSAGVGKAEVERAVAHFASTDGALTSEILNKLLAGNSVYVQRAREAGERYAAEKGLLTSSMAAGAAHGAAVDRAGEIAKADAQAGLQVNLNNSQVGTNVNLANASEANRASLQANELNAQAAMQKAAAVNTGVLDSIAFGRNSEFQKWQMNQSRVWGVDDQKFAAEQDAFWKNQGREWGLKDSNSNYLRSLADKDTDYLRNLENREYNTATTNRAQALQYMTGFDSSMMESLKGIWSDPNLTAEQKQTLANKFISDGTALRNSTLNAIFSGVPGFSASFEKFPGAAPGTNVPATGIDPKSLNPIAVTPPVRVEPKYLPVGR